MPIPYLLIAAIIAVIWAVIVILGVQGWAKDQLEELLNKFDIDSAAATTDYSKNQNYAQAEMNNFFDSNSSVVSNKNKLTKAIQSKANFPLVGEEIKLINELSERVAHNVKDGKHIQEIHMLLKVFKVV